MSFWIGELERVKRDLTQRFRASGKNRKKFILNKSDCKYKLILSRNFRASLSPVTSFVKYSYILYLASSLNL